jgi:unsaturated rhamnogalacturonyl hydrolase
MDVSYQYNMKKYLIISIMLCIVCGAEAKKWKQSEVIAIINKVNSYWQDNNPAEVSSFWDNAAYHTGNIEAYLLTNNDTYRQYSERWAEHNHWQGATETDPSLWQYRKYGEDQQHVLFGDWQICFYTYIDLFNIANGQQYTTADSPYRNRIVRAMEVMSIEADSKANDYWWWADALYMVMPVMTKMYKLTDDEKYLDKLYDNIQYSDSIMLDKETGLYFRDGKYVYPTHKTANGKKDFWARGDGWVLAGLAKVLKDMPRSYKHRQFFVDKYVRLAHAVAALQQRDGYWTRSMMDPAQAPGPETSGTAFFTYGMLWGINNGILSQKEFAPVIRRAWKYLTTTALQSSGKVGYVQPIGERAIPGQMINADSQANFGVGAFLLAACEYVRYLDRTAIKHRSRATMGSGWFVSGGVGVSHW